MYPEVDALRFVAVSFLQGSNTIIDPEGCDCPDGKDEIDENDHYSRQCTIENDEMVTLQLPQSSVINRPITMADWVQAAWRHR